MTISLIHILFYSITSFAQSSAPDVLYIGDSHSAGCFGQELDRSLRTLESSPAGNHLQVRTVATCGSSTASWLNKNGNSTTCGYRSCPVSGSCETGNAGHADSLQTLLQPPGSRSGPKVTLIALGSNMLKAPAAVTLKDVARLISEVKASGSQCLWVGPPQPALFFIPAAVYENFNSQLQNAVEANGCRFISSQDKTRRENLSDPMGLHYSCKDGTAWAQKAFSQISPLVRADLGSSKSSAVPRASAQ